MKPRVFQLAFYDPLNEAAPLRPFYPDLHPDTLDDALELVRLVNEATAEEPELSDVLGLFPATVFESEVEYG